MMARPSFSYSSRGMWKRGRTMDVPVGVSPDDRPAACGESEIRFRSFVLKPGNRMLLRDGQPVELGGKAFDLLEILVSSRGTVVSKDYILGRVWPTTTVEEGNLRVQIASLRRVLGDDRDMIKTIPGRGYLFVAEEAPPEDEHAGPRSLIASMKEWRSDEELQRVLSRLQALQGPNGAFDFQSPASHETCEMLRNLLHSVLDEMWEVVLQGEVLPGRHLAVRLVRTEAI